MKRSIFVSIFIVLIVAVAFFLMMRNPVKAPIQSVAVGENGHQSVSGSGTYRVDLIESILKAQGQKPLISGYTDASLARFKEGNFIVTNGKISGSFTVDMNSISVESTGKGGGESMLERHLKSPDFFDVEVYPESSFEIKSAEKSPEDELYMVTGDLTLKGTTKTINFPAVIYMKDGKLKAEGTVGLDRTLWDIRYGSGKFFGELGDKIISDIFTVEFNITADAQ